MAMQGEEVETKQKNFIKVRRGIYIYIYMYRRAAFFYLSFAIIKL